MKLHINEEALKWYKDELDLKKETKSASSSVTADAATFKKDFPSGYRKMSRSKSEQAPKRTALRFSLRKAIFGTLTTMICV